MRKVYGQPEMEVHIIACTQQLLAGSVTGDSVIDEDAGPGIPGMAPIMTPDELLSPSNILGIPGF